MVKDWVDSTIIEGFFGFDTQIVQTYRAQDQIVNFIFIDFSMLLIKILASLKIFVQMPELIETQKNSLGQYVDSDGEVIEYTNTAEFAFIISVSLSVVTII